MTLRSVAVAAALGGLAAILTPVGAAPANAGGCCHNGCGSARAAACDSYATVERRVVVRRAWREVVREPAVVGTRAEVVEVSPGRVHTVREPAVYGTVMQRVAVAPARVHYDVQPAVYGRVRENVVVSPGRVHTIRHRDPCTGCETVCRTCTPPVVRTVERTVMVAPERRVPVVTPAIYRDVPRTVLVSPARTHQVYEPPVRTIVHRRVVVRPASTHVIDHPPVVGVERRQVRVPAVQYVTHGCRTASGCSRW